MSDPNTQNQGQTALTVVVAALAAVLVGKFADAQLSLLKRLAGLVVKFGALSPLLLSRFQAEARQVVATLQPEIAEAVARVVDRAVRDGAAAAEGVAPKVASLTPAPLVQFESHAERSARAIREDLAGKLNQAGYQILRFTDDAYQAVVADAAQAQVRGLTPANTQRDAFRKLAARGVDGFTDSRGRKWELSAYVEMATRTAVQRAYNVSHLDRMQQLGIELFTVTDDGHPCPLCQPWQGKVLSVDPDPRADATIAEATAAGLFHPRCRHTLVAFVPGVTTIAAAREWTQADADGYAESQRQRALERAIRSAKREQAAAITPEDTAAANRDLRRAQANMRAFIADTGRVRNTRREQLNLGA